MSDDSKVEPASVGDLEGQIAAHEQALEVLRAEITQRSIQLYPKMLYKAANTLAEVVADAVTVLDATAEAEAAVDGFTYSNPADAVTKAALHG